MSKQQMFNEFLKDIAEILRRRELSKHTIRCWHELFGRVVNGTLSFDDDLSDVAVITAWLKGYERGTSK